MFEYAQEQDHLQSIYDELLTLRELYQQQPQLGNALTNAALSPEQKEKIFVTMQGPFSHEMQSFMNIVFGNNRMNDLLLMIDDFEKRYDDAIGRVQATVTTAVPLTDEQAQHLETAFAKRIGAKTTVLTQKVDPSIMGGVIMRANDQVIDGSVRTKLMHIKERLTQQN
ncbi:hypothetical protein IV38_GL000193 [Lactobacillus selangorensis]|uniref:ATP synthase subunit delta n=1 Tax=Lactobacillus selangorensis TaxID=81857 RepID=A0A0R2FM79_9LACO|nr:hypothetical protein IV38_GL000193 [Lactobacillus selangorensis]KRN34161.1 hypothetical protein IV40_GL000476 [Lactobacillus selangorensis]